MEEKSGYREKIVEIISSIEDERIIEYLYYFIKEKTKAG